MVFAHLYIKIETTFFNSKNYLLLIFRLNFARISRIMYKIKEFVEKSYFIQFFKFSCILNNRIDNFI